MQSQLGSFSLSFIGDFNECFKPNLEQLAFQNCWNVKTLFGAVVKQIGV